MRSLVTIGAVLLLLGAGIVAGACTGEDPKTGPGGSSSPGPATEAFELSDVPAISVVQGESVSIDVTVTRSGFDGPITVSVSGLPEGTSASPLVIAAATSQGRLELSASATGSQGKSEITIVASDAEGKITRQRTTTLLVRGPAGTRDLSFGDRGTVELDGNTAGYLAAIAVQPDGKVVVTGNVDQDIFALRLEENGALDKTFGSGNSGKNILDLRDEGGATADTVTSLALAGDSVVLGGYSTQPTSKYAVVRLDATGKLDPSFDGDGYVISHNLYRTNANGDLLVDGVAAHADGRIVIAGTVLVEGRDRLMLARLKTNGAFDKNAFGGTGFLDTSVSDTSSDRCLSVAIAADDKVICAGSTEDGPNLRFVAWRVNSDGTNDATFGNDGVATVDSSGAAEAVFALPESRVLLAGVAGGVVEAVRLSANGGKDPLFAGSGARTVSWGEMVSGSLGAAVDAQGRLFVAAPSDYREAYSHELGIARLLPDGSDDTAFAPLGRMTLPIPHVSRARVALAPDGRIVIALAYDDSRKITLLRLWD